MKPVLPRTITSAFRSAIAIMVVFGVAALIPVQAQAACANPVGDEGAVIYNDAFSVLQYCDDTDWIGIPDSPVADVNTYGLVGRWRFDESGATTTASDWASGNNGTLTNFATPASSWQPTGGKIGGSLVFGGNAVDEKVLLGDPAALQIPTAITMAAWVKPHATQPANNGRIISKHNGAVGDHYGLHIGDGLTVDCRINNTVDESATDAVVADIWQHVACTYDGAFKRVYVNGVEIGAYARTGAITTTNTVSIGGHINATDRNFRGELDDVRIYNRALTAQEIYRMAAVETGNTYSANGYFVETEAAPGNMGGLTGANALCLSRLQTGSWYGKDAALANGQLTASNVKAWLCASTGCNNLDPFSTYNYASTVNSSNVGVSMNIGAGGFIENDGVPFESPSAFGAGGGYREYFTGRGTNNQPGADNCSDWTSNATNVNTGASDVSFYAEKLFKFTRGCASVNLICLVGAKPGCVEPAGAPGDIIYDDDHNVMVYCNGNGWVPFSAQVSAPDSAGLTAHYKFEHTAGTSLTDHAGSHTGTLNNFTLPAAWTAGHIGANALDFDGTDDYVDLASPGDFSFDAAGTYTWAVWINPDDFEEWNTVFGAYINPNTSPTLAISAHTTAETGWGPVTAGISAGIDGGGSERLNFHTTDNVLTTGTWSHVAVTYNGSLTAANRIKIYVNGVDVTSSDVQVTGVMPNVTFTNARLSHNGWTDEFFDGRMDDFRFYTRVLSESEIQALAAYGPAPGTCANPTGNAGMMIYNNTANVVQFCNGKDWIAAGR